MYAPANAVDVFVHNGWTSNYASVGNGYDPTQDYTGPPTTNSSPRRRL